MTRIEPIRGSVDVPDGTGPIRRDAIVVKGWACGNGSPVSFVDVWLGERWLGRAGLGRPRPDVARALSHADSELSGFELRRELSGLDLPAERATLRARVTLLDGAQGELPPVEVALAPPPRAPEPAVSPPPRPRRSRSGRLRILWFERALGRGGSQLRLRDLIEQLRETESPESTVIAHSEGPLREALERAGAAVEVCDPVAVHHEGEYERRIEALTAASEGRFDLVVGHTLTSFPAIDLADRLGLPSIWRIGEAEPLSTVVGWIQGGLHSAVKARARRAFAAASAVVFNSNAALRAQQASGVTGRFVVVKTGVDVRAAQAYRAGTDRDACRRALGIPSDLRLLVALGKLWPLKGQALLVQAQRQVRSCQPGLACALLGEPTQPYAAALSRFAAGQGLGDSVRILPFLEDVRPWLVSADVAVCPSETESLPASVLEAMAFGLPVLATRVGDLPELVVPGSTGWLCEPSHLGSLCASLEQVATATPDELRALGGAAADKVRVDHDRDAALARMVDLIRDVTR